MQAKDYTERDWKLLRSKIAGWQESYIRRLNQGYIELLSQEGSEAEKFWALEKRIRKDKRDAGVIVDMRRSAIVQNIYSLLDEGAITTDNLEDFSDDLKAAVEWRQQILKQEFKPCAEE